MRGSESTTHRSDTWRGVRSRRAEAAAAAVSSSREQATRRTSLASLRRAVEVDIELDSLVEQSAGAHAHVKQPARSWLRRKVASRNTPCTHLVRDSGPTAVSLDEQRQPSEHGAADHGGRGRVGEAPCQIACWMLERAWS